jgi:hypothetical protein
MIQVLDRVILGTQDGVPGYFVPAGNGLWTFIPLAVSELANISQRTLFYTPAAVTGQILSYGVIISGVTYNTWNIQTQVGKEFEIIATAKYQASSSVQTRMDMTVWRPSGSMIQRSDTDIWPYSAPNTNLNFHIQGVAGEAFDIDEAGTWLAELKYVWVS